MRKRFRAAALLSVIIVGFTTATVAKETPKSFPANSQKIALVYNGFGADASNVSSVLEILRTNGLAYKTVNHTSLNSMPLNTLVTYSIIIVPGGQLY